jgi:hypothetical protein
MDKSRVPSSTQQGLCYPDMKSIQTVEAEVRIYEHAIDAS